MELQLPVAQSVDLLQQRDAKHLISAQTTPPRVLSPISDEVAVNELGKLRMGVQDPGDHLQLSGMLVRTPSGREGELIFSELAHRFTPGSRFDV